jgi:hypothetical protein
LPHSFIYFFVPVLPTPPTRINHLKLYSGSRLPPPPTPASLASTYPINVAGVTNTSSNISSTRTISPPSLQPFNTSQPLVPIGNGLLLLYLCHVVVVSDLDYNVFSRQIFSEFPTLIPNKDALVLRSLSESVVENIVRNAVTKMIDEEFQGTEEE